MIDDEIIHWDTVISIDHSITKVQQELTISNVKPTQILSSQIMIDNFFCFYIY